MLSTGDSAHLRATLDWWITSDSPRARSPAETAIISRTALQDARLAAAWRSFYAQLMKPTLQIAN